jgi:hypothetical protein
MGSAALRGCLAALCVTCGWAVAPEANAQEPQPDHRRSSYGARGVGTGDWVFVPQLKSVFQRPQPEYEPLGIRMGSWVLSPEVTFEGGYDDNVFADETDKADDFFGTATPAVRLRSDWPVHLLGFEASGNIVRYADETSEDVEEPTASAFGRLDITRDDTVYGSARYHREVQGRGDPEDEGGQQTEYDFWAGRMGYAHQFAVMHLRVDARGQRYDYLNSDDQDRDRDELDLGTRLTYALSPKFTPFVQGGYSISDFDDAVDDSGVDRDQTEYSAGVGGRLLLTDVLIAEVSVGAFRVEFEDSSLDSFTSLAFSGDLIWNVTDLTSVIAEGFRRESPTTQGNASSRIDTGGGIRVEHELLRNLLLFGEASYRNEDFRNERVDDRYEAAVGAEYLLNRNVSLFSEYSYERRESDEEERDFTRNLGIVGVRITY